RPLPECSRPSASGAQLLQLGRLSDAPRTRHQDLHRRPREHSLRRADVQDYLEILEGGPVLRARVGAYRADVALFPDSGLVHGLLKLEPPWTILYRDMTAVLLAPPNSPLIAAHPDPAVVLADEPQFLRYQARKAYTAGELDAAIGLLERAIQREPLLV